MHALTVTTRKGVSTGTCSCGKSFGPHSAGAGTIRHPTDSLDRVYLSWSGRSVVEAEHRCHALWRETPTALQQAA